MRTPTDQEQVSRAFCAGYEYGLAYGDQSPREADAALRDIGIPTTLASGADLCAVFCEGASDGARGDTFRLTAKERERLGY